MSVYRGLTQKNLAERRGEPAHREVVIVIAIDQLSEALL